MTALGSFSNGRLAAEAKLISALRRRIEIRSVRIREYNPSDLETLRRMHAAQGFGYPLPDLESPLFLSKLVLEDDGEDAGSEREEANQDSPRVGSSRVTMAILQRLTAETYLLHDPSAGTPRRRWQSFLAIHDAARIAAASHGLDDVQAFLPPPIARAFGRRLARLGWTRDPWPCFSRRIP
jgi:hypothetical protein